MLVLPSSVALAESGCTLTGGYGQPRIEYTCPSFRALSIEVPEGADPQVVAQRELDAASVRMGRRVRQVQRTVGGRIQKAASIASESPGGPVFVVAGHGDSPRDGHRTFLCIAPTERACVLPMEELMAGGLLTGVQVAFPTVLDVAPRVGPECSYERFDVLEAVAACRDSKLTVAWSADTQVVDNLVMATQLLGYRYEPATCAIGTTVASRCQAGSADANRLWIAVFDSHPPVQVVCERHAAEALPDASCPLSVTAPP